MSSSNSHSTPSRDSLSALPEVRLPSAILAPVQRAPAQHNLIANISPAFAYRAILRWWLLALPTGLLLTGAAAAYLWITFQPQYRSAAWVQIQETPMHLAYPVQDNPRRFIQNQIELIKSPLVIGPAMGQPDLGNLPELEKQREPIAWLAKRIRVVSVGESELFEISLDSADAVAAAKFVNALVESYLVLRTEHDATRNQRMLDLLDEEKQLRAQEVGRMRENVRELSKQILGKDPFTGARSAEVIVMNSPIDSMLDRLSAHEVDRKMIEVQLASFDESGNKTPREMHPLLLEGAIEQRPEVKEIKAMLANRHEIRDRVEETSVNGKDDPAFRRAIKEVERVQQMLAKTRDSLRATVKEELETKAKIQRGDEIEMLQRRLTEKQFAEQALREQYDKRIKSASQNGNQSLELEFAKAELAREEKVFELIAQRALALRTETRAPARVTLMKPATPVSVPMESFPFKKLVMAAIACLGLPFGLAVFWESSVRRINDAQQLDQDAQVSVIGEVARLPMRGGRLQGNGQSQYDLSLFEESVDSLRTCLVLGDSRQDIRIIAVASAVSGEGKTSVAAQLAVSIARATGEKTLLIDADLRSPDVHHVFQIEDTLGLAGVLESKCSLSEAINSTWSEFVHLLPAGQITSNPHALLNNSLFRKLLDDAKAQYTYIIIDTPPILLASESLVVAKEADGTLLCTMRDRSRESQVRAACERLRAVGARNLGAVLSGIPAKQYATKYGSYPYSRDYSHV